MTVGWVTLDVGEQALVYALQGDARVEVGPKRLFLFREKLIRLDYHAANQSEFLVIKHRDGQVLHKQGPCVMFENPLEHISVDVRKGISLDANEVLVVYQKNSKTTEVNRYLHQGPTLYIPAANEWLHVFKWHGTDPDNKTRMIPGSHTFTKLKVIPDQFYYNVDEVRTTDDALIRIKLMVFYELKDINKMLNATQDPMADFVNCLCADIIAFASKLQYMEFIERSGELNDLKNYPQLLERCNMIGYLISKVVFRGYYASGRLQAMHDNAVRSRTKLKIEYETEEQTQDMTDMSLSNDLERITLEQSMEKENLKHKQALESSQQAHQLTMKLKEQEERVKRYKSEEQGHLLARKAKNENTLKYYQQLSDMDVKMTEFVLSENPHPNKITRIMNVGGEKAANIHFHQN